MANGSEEGEIILWWRPIQGAVPWGQGRPCQGQTPGLTNLQEKVGERGFPAATGGWGLAILSHCVPISSARTESPRPAGGLPAV